MIGEIKIESKANKRIKDIKLLSKKKNRWKDQKFIVEGIRSVGQLLESSYSIDTLVYSNSLLDSERGKGLLDLFSNTETSIIRTTDDVFKYITDTEEPQWIMAIVNFGFRDIGDISYEDGAFFVLLDRVQDPGNMGTIIRTAEAFGADAVILTEGCVDIYNPKTIRSSMGSIIQIPIVYSPSIKDIIRDLKDRRVEIVSSSPLAQEDVYHTDLTGNIALVIGNEGCGISDTVMDLSDIKVNIPMAGKAESLNAGVASGVLMYEVLRQRIEKK